MEGASSLVVVVCASRHAERIVGVAKELKGKMMTEECSYRMLSWRSGDNVN